MLYLILGIVFGLVLVGVVLVVRKRKTVPTKTKADPRHPFRIQ